MIPDSHNIEKERFTLVHILVHSPLAPKQGDMSEGHSRYLLMSSMQEAEGVKGG